MLDERNLKLTANRYGTLPKGARIGAYLESLQQQPGAGGGSPGSGMMPSHLAKEPAGGASTSSNCSLDRPVQANDQFQDTLASHRSGFTGILFFKYILLLPNKHSF